MSITFLVRRADGTVTRKTSDEIEPDEELIVDGPDAFASVQAAQARLDAEIEAAGGLDAWRAVKT